MYLGSRAREEDRIDLGCRFARYDLDRDPETDPERKHNLFRRIFEQFTDRYRERYGLTAVQARALGAIRACRTPRPSARFSKHGP